MALEGEVKDCLKKFTENGSSLQKYRLFCYGLIAEIMRFGNKNQLDMEELFRKESDIYQMVFQPESFEELCEWLIGVGEKVQEMLSSERQNNTKSFVTRAVEYVRENYADQSISIETVCRTLGVSAAYFSTVFKKETGKTFIGYLTDYRMEAAGGTASDDGRQNLHDCGKSRLWRSQLFQLCFQEKIRGVAVQVSSGENESQWIRRRNFWKSLESAL